MTAFALTQFTNETSSIPQINASVTATPMLNENASVSTLPFAVVQAAAPAPAFPNFVIPALPQPNFAIPALPSPNLVIPALPPPVVQDIGIADRVFKIVVKVQTVTIASSSSNVTSNSSDSNAVAYAQVLVNKTVSQLCGFPIFCSSLTSNVCANTTLNHCSECSRVGAGLFAAFCIILGLLIVFGNGIVLSVVIKSGLKDSFSKIKASLAFADVLTGIQLLVIVMYNFAWVINATASELDTRQLELRGSGYAVAGGMFLLLTLTSSLYHLTFMSGQRFYAIMWPMKFRLQKERNVIIGLTAIWILSVLSATAPGWFPDHITYTYHQVLMLFYVAPQNVGKQANYAAVTILMVLFYIMPYIVMSVLSFATAFIVRSNIRKASKLKKGHNTSQKQGSKMDKREVSIFVTVAMMQIGFTLTIILVALVRCMVAIAYYNLRGQLGAHPGILGWEMIFSKVVPVPLVIVNSLFYVSVLDCFNSALPFTLTFYLCMANSLVNVMVYSIREKKFRQSVMTMLLPCLVKKLYSSGRPISSSFTSKATEHTVANA